MTDEQIEDMRLVLAALEYISDGYHGEYGHHSKSPEDAVEACMPPGGFDSYVRLKAFLIGMGLTTSQEWSW